MLANNEDFFKIFTKFLPKDLSERVVLVRDDRRVTPFRQRRFPEVLGTQLVKEANIDLKWLHTYPLTLKLLYPWVGSLARKHLNEKATTLFLDDDCAIFKSFDSAEGFAAANEGRLGMQKVFAEHDAFRQLFNNTTFAMDGYNRVRLNSGVMAIPPLGTLFDAYRKALTRLANSTYFSSRSGWARFFIEQKFWNYFLKIHTEFYSFPRKQVLFDNSTWGERRAMRAPNIFHYAYGEKDIGACVNWLRAARFVEEEMRLVVESKINNRPVIKFRHQVPEKTRTRII